MESLCPSSLASHLSRLPKSQFCHPMFNFTCSHTPTSSFSQIHKRSSKPKLISAISSPVSVETRTPPDTDLKIQNPDEKFDWFAQWYAVMPVCDLDKRVPHAKRVMGLDVVVWWDRNENGWKVFDDCCPHRLAPLSEGRIDQWGRLQCVYHGWCFNGSGDCKFIPQAPRDGPPVHTVKKACVAAYPSTVQNGIVWFWPNTDPQFNDILIKKKPPYIPELDDPSYTNTMGNRDIPYGYEVLIENLMDPAHVPYAHYGIMGGTQPPPKSVKADREGGRPVEMSVQKLDINGFVGRQEWGSSKFIPPCLFYAFTNLVGDQETKEPSTGMKQRRALLIFICIPVSPGKSRLIWAFPRNFKVWIDQVVPRWIFHVGQNLILDSDLYLLHVEEHKILDAGPNNWQKACFLPTKSDALVVGFRKWLNKYAGGQIEWGTKFNGGALPPTPPKEQLMERYRSHVVNCRSCTSAYKSLGVLEVALQVVSVAMIGIVAATKVGMASASTRAMLVSIAVLFYVASRWLAHFIYKNFHFHDYNHALR